MRLFGKIRDALGGSRGDAGGSLGGATESLDWDEIATAFAFIDSFDVVDSVPPGQYPMWWAEEGGQIFEETACFKSWDDVYRALDGVESWALTHVLKRVGLLGDEVGRVRYPEGGRTIMATTDGSPPTQIGTVLIEEG